MLSPGTTSLDITSAGRDGSHSTDQPSERAQGQGKGRVESSGLYLKNIKLARLSILILSKAYPFMVYIAM
jgi:hypothetical protein